MKGADLAQVRSIQTGLLLLVYELTHPKLTTFWNLSTMSSRVSSIIFLTSLPPRCWEKVVSMNSWIPSLDAPSGLAMRAWKTICQGRGRFLGRCARWWLQEDSTCRSSSGAGLRVPGRCSVSSRTSPQRTGEMSLITPNRLGRDGKS